MHEHDDHIVIPVVHHRVTLEFGAAARVSAIAIVVGVAADVLLRDAAFGLNVVLFVLVCVAGAFAVARGGGVELAGEGRWLVVPLLGFALGLMWRDSPTL